MVMINSFKFNPSNENIFALTTGYHPNFNANILEIHQLHPQDQSVHPFYPPITTVSDLNDCTWSTTHHNLIVMATDNGSSHLIDIDRDAGDNPRQSFSLPNRTRTTSVDWRPRSHSFLAASSHGRVNHWEIDQANPHYTCIHPRWVQCVTWNPRNELLFASTCWDGYLRIWDIRHQHPVKIIQAADGALISCDWHWDMENIIVTASLYSHVIRVWDLNRPNHPILIFGVPQTGMVHKVKFLRNDYNFIASISNNGLMTLWDPDPADAFQMVASVQRHESGVLGLDVGKGNQHWLGSSGEDGRVVISRDVDLETVAEFEM